MNVNDDKFVQISAYCDTGVMALTEAGVVWVRRSAESSWFRLSPRGGLAAVYDDEGNPVKRPTNPSPPPPAGAIVRAPSRSLWPF